jgi:hypothetical protein
MVLALMIRFSDGKEPPRSGESNSPVRVLVTHGGHAFQEKPFFAMFQEMEGVHYQEAEMPEALDLFRPGLGEKYDVVVMYDMFRFPISERQKENFLALLETGEIALLSLHHNLGAYRDWPEYRKIIGGSYVFEPFTAGGEQYGKSTFAHDQDVTVTVDDREHPITEGVETFEIHDEVYGSVYVAPEVNVLLTTEHPKASGALAWTHRYRHTPVFHLMLGHDGRAFDHQSFRKVLRQGILWLASRTDRPRPKVEEDSK